MCQKKVKLSHRIWKERSLSSSGAKSTCYHLEERNKTLEKLEKIRKFRFHVRFPTIG